MTGFHSKRDAAADKLQEPVANSFEEYCKTLHPLWNTHISRTYAEQFFRAGQSAQTAQEPVATVTATVTSETGNPDVTMSWWHEPALLVGTKLYTAPPKRPWVGLEKSNMPDGENPMFDHEYFIAGMVFASNVLKKKNT